MPWAPKKLCGYGPCTELTTGKYCLAHAKPKWADSATRREYERNRPSSTKRGYGRRWAKRRMMVLRRHPGCEMEECQELATEVHHILPKKERGPDSFENLQALCKKHHTMITFCGG